MPNTIKELCKEYARAHIESKKQQITFLKSEDIGLAQALGSASADPKNDDKAVVKIVIAQVINRLEKESNPLSFLEKFKDSKNKYTYMRGLLDVLTQIYASNTNNKNMLLLQLADFDDDNKYKFSKSIEALVKKIDGDAGMSEYHKLSPPVNQKTKAAMYSYEDAESLPYSAHSGRSRSNTGKSS